MPNTLHNEASPYLKNLSKQPVHWQPWGKQALDQAQKENKPVLISIGYSSCHWCKQMSRENYEDPYIASIMNRHFTCIKIDREERPDLDLLYMEASRMFNQSAGWPLHAFCLPDGSPFWCGTYFPKEDNGQGIAPWPQVLMRIAEHYKHNPEELIENGKNALANLSHSNHAQLSDPREWSSILLLEAGKALIQSHDDAQGGFTPAPKFPSPMKMDFLFALSESSAARNTEEVSEKLDFCLTKTLNSMASRGLFDHVNGGFFRYCLDREWNSPHFEKMLSDNALLLSTFSRSWRKYQNPQDRKVIEQTLQWIDNEMGTEQEGYACSLSAEINGVEGGYYLWTHKELSETLGPKEADLVISKWNPFTQGSDPLFLPRSFSSEDISVDQEAEILSLLKKSRSQLDKPTKDEKRSCSQHALLAKAWVDTGVALAKESLIHKACNLLKWMDSVFKKPDGSISSIRYPDQSTSSFSFLEDQAFWVEAILAMGAISEIYKLGKLETWLTKAEDLLLQTVEKFKDPTLPGFFSCPDGFEDSGPTRKKSWYDHAMPSGNSSLIRCFHTLGQIGKNQEKWNAEYREALAVYPKLAKASPDGIGHALCCLTEAAVGVITIQGPHLGLREIAYEMRQLSYRPTFFVEQKNYSLQINQKKVQLTEPTAAGIISQIWDCVD
jgi:uncharacterized protein YyaL (SSP411 family)